MQYKALKESAVRELMEDESSEEVFDDCLPDGSCFIVRNHGKVMFNGGESIHIPSDLPFYGSNRRRRYHFEWPSPDNWCYRFCAHFKSEDEATKAIYADLADADLQPTTTALSSYTIAKIRNRNVHPDDYEVVKRWIRP